MNGISPEGLTHRKQTLLHRGSDRWADWARFLIESHRWNALRRHMPIMIIVRPWVPPYLLYRRWQRHVWRLCPKITLVIGPILQTIGKYSPKNKEVPSKQLVEANLEGHNIPGERIFSPTKAFYMSNPAAPEQTSVFNPPNVARQAPLRLAFARMNHRHTLTLLSQSLIEQESCRIPRRVVHERRRVEEKIHRNTSGAFAIPIKPSMPEMIVVRRQKDFISVEADRTEMESQHTPRTGARMVSQTSLSPTINVEQLTEHVIRQIDHRIRAYRERRGKLGD